MFFLNFFPIKSISNFLIFNSHFHHFKATKTKKHKQIFIEINKRQTKIKLSLLFCIVVFQLKYKS
jgi:hypothetical protein